MKLFRRKKKQQKVPIVPPVIKTSERQIKTLQARCLIPWEYIMDTNCKVIINEQDEKVIRKKLARQLIEEIEDEIMITKVNVAEGLSFGAYLNIVEEEK